MRPIPTRCVHEDLVASRSEQVQVSVKSDFTLSYSSPAAIIMRRIEPGDSYDEARLRDDASTTLIPRKEDVTQQCVASETILH